MMRCREIGKNLGNEYRCVFSSKSKSTFFIEDGCIFHYLQKYCIIQQRERKRERESDNEEDLISWVNVCSLYIIIYYLLLQN